MKTQKIIIKDVTGDNAGYLWELSREGYPAGTIVRNFEYRVRHIGVTIAICLPLIKIVELMYKDSHSL